VGGFVVALVGVVLSLIPIINNIAFVLAAIGLVLGIIGLVKARQGAPRRGLAVAAIVLAVVGGIGVVASQAFYGKVLDDVADSLDGAVTAPATQPAAADDDDAVTEPADTATDEVADAAPDAAPEASFADGLLTMPDMTIQITDHRVIQPGEDGNEYGDTPVIAFWYQVTNTADGSLNPTTAWLFTFSAFQDNNPNAENELNVASLPDDQFLDTQLETIKIGGTVENAVAYELDDSTTPVDLVASKLLGDELGRMQFAIAP
jgi:hypothetical protein